MSRTVVGRAPRAIVRAILRGEAAKAGLALADLLGQKRSRKLAAARHAALQRLHDAFPAKHATKSLSSRTLAKPAAKQRGAACDPGPRSDIGIRESGVGTRGGELSPFNPESRSPNPDPRSARPWTPAMTAFLVRKRREGKSFGWIAKALGVSRSVVIGRAAKRTLARRWRARTRVTQQARADEPAPLGPLRELLDEGRCRWIAGDIADADWRMCGHPSVHGRTWCAYHVARVFEPAQENGDGV
jgi:GcrA cell cycle regulator